jgi:NADPH:quinone reductase-like Zn-dependent oxidoreductase
MLALKLAQASGLRVIMTSSSDAKAKAIQEQFTSTPVHTINYKNNPNWHEAVLRLTEGVGVDLVVENGGTESLTKSIKCTRRGGTVSQVGYLSKQDPADLKELIPLIIDRRVSVR